MIIDKVMVMVIVTVIVIITVILIITVIVMVIVIVILMVIFMAIVNKQSYRHTLITIMCMIKDKGHVGFDVERT